MLNETNLHKNPFDQFEVWMQDVLKSGIEEPGAMALATADAFGKPSVRIVLLKHYDHNGFRFFTNYSSRKGAHLEVNNYASILFYWQQLERQIHIEGPVFKLSPIESETYFASRPRNSNIAAVASPQSQFIRDREFLENRVAYLSKKLEKRSIPRPEDWGGYRLKPDYFEFWQGRENRLHDRFRYARIDGQWKINRIAP